MDAQESITNLVYAPNLHLFAFHLWRGLTGETDSTAPNPHFLWQKGDEILKTLKFEERLKLYGYHHPQGESEPLGAVVNLHPHKSVKLQGKLADNDLEITGRIFAHRLYDSYSLTVNFRRDEKVNGAKTADVEISFWQKLNQQVNQQRIFLPDFVKSSLGQTLLLTAFLPQEYQEQSDASVAEFAQRCLGELIPESKSPPLHKMGELFGSPIFEFGGQILDFDSHGEPDVTPHVLIWLFREDSPSAKFVAAYRQFIDLFYYRNKILAAYRETRLLYRKTYAEYTNLEKKVKNFRDLLGQKPQDKGLSNEQLENLKTVLKELAALDLEYARLLRNYKHCRNTISINSKNYKETLKAILRQLQDKKHTVQPENLDFFREFTSVTAPYFQTRISDELNYFVEGSNLADKAIASIRGIVEIEQTQRDRLRQDQEKSLEDTIQALGLALGTGAIVASSAGLITFSPSPWDNKGRSDYPHPFITAVLASFTVAILVYTVARIWQKWGKKG